MSAFFWWQPSTMAFDVGAIQKVAALHKNKHECIKVSHFFFTLHFLHFIAVVVLNSWTCNSLHNYMILMCCWRCLHVFIINSLCCMMDQLMLHTSFKGRRERETERENVWFSIGGGRWDKVEAREDQDVAMAAEMERTMVKNVLNANLADMVLNLIILITTWQTQ